MDRRERAKGHYNIVTGSFARGLADFVLFDGKMREGGGWRRGRACTHNTDVSFGYMMYKQYPKETSPNFERTNHAAHEKPIKDYKQETNKRQTLAK